MSKEDYSPFDEGSEHPKVGCGAVNCCQSCDGNRKEPERVHPLLVLGGALLFLIIVTTVARYLFAR